MQAVCFPDDVSVTVIVDRESVLRASRSHAAQLLWRLYGRAHIETQATQPALAEAAQVSVTQVFDNDSAS